MRCDDENLDGYILVELTLQDTVILSLQTHQRL
jgi:hypothetical protein